MRHRIILVALLAVACGAPEVREPATPDTATAQASDAGSTESTPDEACAGAVGQLSAKGCVCSEWIACQPGLHCKTDPVPPGTEGSGPPGVCEPQACQSSADCNDLTCATCSGIDTCVFDCVSGVCQQRGCPAP